MRLSGQGITGYKTFNIKNDFIPNTEIALKWAQAYNGAWLATDRGASYDVYKTTVTTVAREDAINVLLQDLYANRTVAHADANILTLDWFASDEKIFGADVDHSGTIQAKVMSIGKRVQRSLYAWQVEIDLIAMLPISFTGSAGSVTFRHIDIGYTGDSDYMYQQQEVYLANPVTTDMRSDTGVFEFTATITVADMITFRRSLASQRSAPITTTAALGVRYPFGPNRSAVWPKNLKYLEVKELGMWGEHYHRVQCKCVEDV